MLKLSNSAEAARASVQEAPKWSSSRALIIGWLTLAALFGGFGWWTAAAPLSGAVIAAGKIEVERDRIVVQHPNGGVVEAIYVLEGSRVSAGDILFKIDGEQMRGELAIVDYQFFETLARRSRLEAERSASISPVFPELLLETASMRPDVADTLEGQLALFRARSDTQVQVAAQLEQRLEQVSLQIEGIDAQLAAMQDQLSLLSLELLSQESLLSQGLTLAPRVLALRREVGGMKGEIGQLLADRAASNARIAEIGIEKLRLVLDRREAAEEQLVELAIREQELAERRALLKEELGNLEVRAPVSGGVLNLQVTASGAVIRPAEPVLDIVPGDRPLIVVTRVQPSDVDEIYLGQPARVMLSGFGRKVSADLTGTVSQVSADVLTDPATGMVYYRVEIVLEATEIAKLGDNVLVPGMPAEIFLTTQSRTPLTWLVEPLSHYLRKAMREY